MLLALNEDEAAIAQSAAALLADVLPTERLHAPDGADLTPEARLRLAKLGWFGLALPEASGGSGLSSIEHALFFCELGRQCGPVDVLAQVLAALTAADSKSLRPAILSGQIGAALAVEVGKRTLLLGAPHATLAVRASPDGADLIDISDIAGESLAPLDPSTSMRNCSLKRAPIVASSKGPRVWLMGEIGAAAMLVGLAEQALHLIVEYAKVRETFGKKIGSYQAIRHPCADMALRVEAARAQLWYAATALHEGKADAIAHVNAAKYLAQNAAVTNAEVSIQLHGGIGITDEHNAHLILKHALLLSRLFGTKRALLAQLLHARLET